VSTASLSRTSVSTIAELIAAINGRAELRHRRRQELASALRRFCRKQRRNAADVSAEPASVRQELESMSPQNTGLSPAAFRNMKSLVGQALLLAEVTSVPRRSRTPLLPAWHPVVGAIADRHRGDRLIHFGRYQSARGIEPADVDQEVMDGYCGDVVSKSMLTRPKQAVRETVLAWNEAVEVLGCPDLQKLSVPNNRRRYVLSPEAFPMSFRADLDAYLLSLRGDDLFAEDDLFGEGRSSPASPDTIASWRKQILAITSALVEAGRDPQSIHSLADLVDPEAAKAALTLVWRRLGQRKTGYLHNLALRLIHLGRHWVKLPQKDFERVRALRRRLDPGKGGMTETNRKKLVQFADRTNVRRLIQLPQRLMDEAVHLDRGGASEAVLAQTAVAIAIELVAMLRIKTLVNLTEEHLLRSHPGRRAIVHLVIPGTITKNRRPIELALPPWVVELIDVYRQRFRPRLMTQPDLWLFPGRNGPKDRMGMSKQVSAAIRKYTGLKMHTHLFRHLAGLLYLTRFPGDYETVRQLLGHRSIETTIRFYCGIEQVTAFLRFDEIISSYLAPEDDRDAAE
jgi:integrase